MIGFWEVASSLLVAASALRAAVSIPAIEEALWRHRDLALADRRFGRMERACHVPFGWMSIPAVLLLFMACSAAGAFLGPVASGLARSGNELASSVLVCLAPAAFSFFLEWMENASAE